MEHPAPSAARSILHVEDLWRLLLSDSKSGDGGFPVDPACSPAVTAPPESAAATMSNLAPASTRSIIIFRSDMLSIYLLRVNRGKMIAHGEYLVIMTASTFA